MNNVISISRRQEMFSESKQRELDFLKTHLAAKMQLISNNSDNKLAPDFWSEKYKGPIELKSENYKAVNIAIELDSYIRAKTENVHTIIHTFIDGHCVLIHLDKIRDIKRFLEVCDEIKVRDVIWTNTAHNGKQYKSKSLIIDISRFIENFPFFVTIIHNYKTEDLKIVA